jgi:hypothetical protein
MAPPRSKITKQGMGAAAALVLFATMLWPAFLISPWLAAASLLLTAIAMASKLLSEDAHSA